MREYSQVTGENVSLADLGPEPQLSDFYHPSADQKDRDIAFVILGVTATGLVAYKLAKHPKWVFHRHAAAKADTTKVVRWVSFQLFFSAALIVIGLPKELYFAMLGVGWQAKRHKLPGPLARTMIDVAQKSLDLWQQD